MTKDGDPQRPASLSVRLSRRGVVVASREPLLLQTLLMVPETACFRHRRLPSLVPLWLLSFSFIRRGKYIYIFVGYRLYRAGCEERRLIAVWEASQIARIDRRRAGRKADERERCRQSGVCVDATLKEKAGQRCR